MSTLEQRMRLEVARVITNVSNWPDAVAPHMLGRDLAGPTDMITEALAPVIRKREAEAWDACVHAADKQWTIGHTSAQLLRNTNPYRSNDE